MIGAFETVLASYENTILEHRKYLADIQKTYDRLVIEAAQKSRPKLKNITVSKALKLLDKAVIFGILDPLRKDCGTKQNQHDSNREILKDKLQFYADQIDLKSNLEDEWLLYDTSDTSYYSSQGFGAYRYADGGAKYLEAIAKAHGLQTRIDVDERTPDKKWGIRSANFRVMVKTNQIGLQVLRCKSHPVSLDRTSFYERIMLNPRVF